LTTTTPPKERSSPGAENKRGYGHHPLLAFLDNTGEFLAARLRPGNAGSVRHEVARVEWLHREEGRLMSTV
jgi:hypothetical protein